MQPFFSLKCYRATNYSGLHYHVHSNFLLQIYFRWTFSSNFFNFNFWFILLFEICYFVSNFNHLKLQIPNNFKFKFFFVGRIPKKTLTHNEFVSFDVHESNYKGEQRNQLQFHELTTILLQNCNTIPKMFEPF